MVALNFQYGQFSCMSADGYFICEGNLIGVQYYGEWRSFRVDRIQPLVDGDTQLEPSSSSPMKHSDVDRDRDVICKLSELELDSPAIEQRESRENVDSGVSEDVSIFKITARSKLKVIEHSVDSKCSKSKVIISCVRV